MFRRHTDSRALTVLIRESLQDLDQSEGTRTGVDQKPIDDWGWAFDTLAEVHVREIDVGSLNWLNGAAELCLGPVDAHLTTY